MMLVTKNLIKDFRGVSSSLQIARNVNFHARNPPDPHYDRKRMIEVCKPIIIPQFEKCPKSTAEKVAEPHPYEVLLSHELKKYWDSSRMILFYHLPPLPARTQREVRNTFFKQDLHFHTYSSNVMKLAIGQTSFNSVLHLYESNTAVVFSEDISVNKVLKINKKVQQQGVAFLAGIIDETFYSRNQVQQIGEVFKKDNYVELAQFLDYVPSKIKSTVNHQTQLLSHYLTQASSENK